MCATSWMLTHLACITHRRMPRGAARRRSQCIGVTQHADLCAARLANTCTHVQDDARSHHVKYGPGVGCASLWDGARCGLEVWPSLIAPARAAARCVLVSCGDAAHPTPQFCRSGRSGAAARTPRTARPSLRLRSPAVSGARLWVTVSLGARARPRERRFRLTPVLDG